MYTLSIRVRANHNPLVTYIVCETTDALTVFFETKHVTLPFNYLDLTKSFLNRQTSSVFFIAQKKRNLKTMYFSPLTTIHISSEIRSHRGQRKGRVLE